MQVINYSCGFESKPVFKVPVYVALGLFDGFHLGHQAVLKRTIELARKAKGIAIAITFSDEINIPSKSPTRILPFPTRIKEFEKIGFDLVVVVTLNRDTIFCDKDFIENLCQGWNVKGMVCGPDFTYGKLKSQTWRNIKLAPVEVIDFIKQHDVKVSSSLIKQMIEDGYIEEVAPLLGHNYFYEGIVGHGQSLGRGFGFPTANVMTNKYSVIPMSGIYLSYITFDGYKYPSLTSISKNPTVSNEGKLSFETFILNFDQDIYGKEVRVELISYLRTDVKFDNVEGLIDQMNKDKAKAVEYFNGLK